MPEHLAQVLYYLQVHLLFASFVALAALVVTSLRACSATTKYWVWVATALNFFLPLGALIDTLAAHRVSATPLGPLGDAGAGIAGSPSLVCTLSALWLVGAGVMAMRLAARVRAEGRAPVGAEVRNGEVPVSFDEGLSMPAVCGVLHPRICLPAGIGRLLTHDELDAVLLHEMRHARRRDNLIRLLFEVGLCALWFHPVVWLVGRRMSAYRELSCDEPVIESSLGASLVSALAKLTRAEEPRLLRAGAGAFLSVRLNALSGSPRTRAQRWMGMLLALAFGGALGWGVLETVQHTACCFLARR